MPMSYQYKGYNPANAKHVQKYNSAHYQRITVNFNKQLFDSEIQPLIDKLGVSPQDFVRQAVTDYIATHKE